MADKIKDRIGQFIAVPVALVDARLSTSAKWLYVILRSYASNDHDMIYPGYKHMEEKAGMRRETIARALTELEASGWITRRRRFSASTVYTLSVPISPDIRTNDTNYSVPISPENRTAISPENRTTISPIFGTLSNSNELTEDELDLVREGTGASAPLTPPTDRMNQPAPPRKARRKTEDPNRDTPPVKVFYDVFERWPTKAQSEMMAELVSDLPRWREICKLWAVNEWDDHRVHNIIDRYQKSFSENGKSKPAARGKSFRRQPATFTDEQREASRRAAAYNIKQREYCQAHGLDPRKDTIDRAAVEAWKQEEK